MISFVLLGTNDVQRATEFYDQICAALGAKRLYEMTTECTGVMYGTGEGPTLGVVLPFDGEPARAGNGVMIALRAGSREDVDKLHALAISLGGAARARAETEQPTAPTSGITMATKSACFARCSTILRPNDQLCGGPRLSLRP